MSIPILSAFLWSLTASIGDPGHTVSAPQDWIGVYRLGVSEQERRIPLIEHRFNEAGGLNPEALLPPDVRPGSAIELRLSGAERPFVMMLLNR